MKKFMLIFYALLSLTSCNSEPSINCSGSNLDKLVETSKEFILSHTLSDRKSQQIHFKSFDMKSHSCVENKRKQKVGYKLNVVAEDQGQVKKVQFSCQFGKLRSGDENSVICQMM